MTQLERRRALSELLLRLILTPGHTSTVFFLRKNPHLDPFPDVFALLLPVSLLFQLEESEFTCGAAVKARKSMEIEIEDLHIQMEDVVKNKLSVSPGSGSCLVTSSFFSAE